MGGRARDDNFSAQDESQTARLRRITLPNAMSVDLVSAFAGDRAMTRAEKTLVRKHEADRGKLFFSDLLYAISHHYFVPEIAWSQWEAVLQHKRDMSEALGRNVRIAVATLDYLSNITGDLPSPTLISETHVSEMANLSMRDGMTGLYNHTSCYELLELEIRGHQRYGAMVSVILLDLDDFKQINDRHGHQEGDRILIAFAKLLTEQVRDSDICCRFGGEEFVAILPFTGSAKEAADIAERIRRAAMTLHCGEQEVTVSAGVAVCDPDTASSRALIERADRALYRAKRAGKNQVAVDLEPHA